MRRLSSPFTVAYKRLMPLAGLATVCVLVWLWPRQASDAEDAHFSLVVVSAAVAIGAAALGLRLRAVVDELWLDGDTLVARKGAVQARIPLASVERVGLIRGRQTRISIVLRGDSALGGRLVFMPAVSAGMFAAFKPHPMVQELRDRLHAAAGRSA